MCLLSTLFLLALGRLSIVLRYGRGRAEAEEEEAEDGGGREKRKKREGGRGREGRNKYTEEEEVKRAGQVNK